MDPNDYRGKNPSCDVSRSMPLNVELNENSVYKLQEEIQRSLVNLIDMKTV